VSPHLNAGQVPARTDVLHPDPEYWTWCGLIVEAEDVREDPSLVDCPDCLDLSEDEPLGRVTDPILTPNCPKCGCPAGKLGKAIQPQCINEACPVIFWDAFSTIGRDS
jgi:hypothetical protein